MSMRWYQPRCICGRFGTPNGYLGEYWCSRCKKGWWQTV